jgi:ribonucleoside-diphosphate reductase alpha chain
MNIHAIAKELAPKGLDLTPFVDAFNSGVTDSMTKEQRWTYAAETAATLIPIDPDFGLLAGRILTKFHHMNTLDRFSTTINDLYNYKHDGRNASLIDENVFKFIKANVNQLENAMDYEKDYSYDIFAVSTLLRAYLLKIDGKPVERIQDMLMRVACGIHYKENDVKATIETYKLLSDKYFTHATPTLFNSGTPNPQLSSCFLLSMKEDSIEGIFDTLKDCANISKYAGGIGLSIHDVRAKGTYIAGTNGTSNGIVPMLKVFNETARYVDQGGGKRKGSFAIYIEPWHADIHDFLNLKKNHGKEEMRARDLFYAMWTPDLFMERVKEDGEWSLFCPNECKGLADVYGEEFNKLYTKYESEGKAKHTIKARDLWKEILTSQIETGTPYMLYKDHANKKSNQKNIGTIKSSNLCTEIMEYTDKDEQAVCNLASLALPKFVKDGEFDFEKLYEVTQVATRNLNKVIDLNFYPTKETKNSNLKRRPIGLGVQGLANVYQMLDIPFTSPEAKELNANIFEVIYMASLKTSNELAKQFGSYEGFEGSPASKGILQFDMWGVEPKVYSKEIWSHLKGEIVKTGLRNSLLIAPMPTASTAQILGNNESFEPFTSNMYVRRVLSGEFVVVNKHLVEYLKSEGKWTEDVRNTLKRDNGSVKNLDIPEYKKEVFKTVWEISQKDLMDMSADRGAFICQSQSFNLHMEDVTFSKLNSAHFYAWKKGLKTGMYYLRTKAAVDAIKFTVNKEIEVEPQACRLDDPDCLSCGA